MLSFMPNGAVAVPAVLSDAGDTTGKGTNDDGLFDVMYSFLVPATVTSGTLEVAAGSFQGVEFTLYTAEQGSTTLDVVAPMTLSLSLPAPPATAAQQTPPWVGEPNPPTSAASTDALASHSTAGSSPSRGFPPGWAVVFLVLAALGAVLVERWRRSRHLAAAAVSTDASASAPSPPGAAPPTTAVVVPEAEGTQEPEPDVTSGVGTFDDISAPASDVAGGVAAGAASPATVVVAEPASAQGHLAFNFIGPRQLLGLADPPSRILEAILAYLLCHDGHHRSADQIQLAMWPFGRRQGDLKPKTFFNYLSQVRAWVGAEHLPDAVTAGGYLVVGIATDGATFGRLCAEADALGGAGAQALRTQALALVRGRPYEGLSGDGYDWIEEEGLVETMTKDIVTCATRLGIHLMEAGEFTAAEDAVRAAVRGAPDDYEPWELGARAIWARADHTALRTWLATAGHHLEAPDVERIRAGLAHQDPPVS
jgi:hypothetical protein